MSWNDDVIEQFRAGHERIVDTFDRDYLVLLHTTGARSGADRISPVAAFDLDGATVIVASAAGADKSPDWYTNLRANPGVRIERWQDGSLVTSSVRAEVVPEGAERDALWQRVTAQSPGFADYQTKTDRVIPLVRLLPDPA